MLKKRVIPCLDVKGGCVVKGVRFQNLRQLDEPASLAEKYMEEGADELVFLDISASSERRTTQMEWVRAVADRIFIPFTVGGGIDSVKTAKEIISLGADKISLNTRALEDPNLIRECALLLGSQAVVLAVDAKMTGEGRWEAYAGGGIVPTGRDAIEWIEEGCSLGAGEVLLTSIDRDGTDSGYDLKLIEAARNAVSVPIIASGGAGKLQHFVEALKAGADAVLAASVFHLCVYNIAEAKDALAEAGFPVRRTW
ncbi:imidazole glycerol phosphate synthase subunit hisF [Acetomicrobium thermoterrenum DSM 13490]|uniref:Imidazole glycerol phosphate synthase subunit HisF n=1 Tax=Acetomicrobium thermoterrenum DSM 13490 TaxID=1120987 RepID=A0A1H3DJF0_9BACT|nr:imidazole glycerol phosphate synthase subunit HisF [Acetomicrobium thermoterrenum]SDX66642.1 imidazole glycerol phosphate synthase subunit hisF [Acetomicrobium thermoterrenum DSM 13490]